ncbi:MAG: KdsC family phosphatase [Chromatiales bacterium]
MQSIRARAARVRLVVFDVDGVLTDGRLILGERGEEFKVFHARDGQGLVMLREAGLRVAVISGRASPVVAERMRSLGIDSVYQGLTAKLPVFEDLLQRLALNAEQAAFVGDDLPDLAILARSGLAVAVADAHPEVIRHAHWCTRLPGGRGAVREVCDLVLDAQGLLQAQHQRYRGA